MQGSAAIIHDVAESKKQYQIFNDAALIMKERR